MARPGDRGVIAGVLNGGGEVGILGVDSQAAGSQIPFEGREDIAIVYRRRMGERRRTHWIWKASAVLVY